MSGGNLDSTSSKLLVNKHRVRDNWDEVLSERMHNKLPVVFLVAFVVRVDSNGGITKKSLGTSGGNNNLIICSNVGARNAISLHRPESWNLYAKLQMEPNSYFRSPWPGTAIFVGPSSWS